jgi:hypothetical protein
MKVLGIFLIEGKKHTFHSESLNLLFSDKNLEFFCDEVPFYRGTEGVFEAMFGKSYEILNSSEGGEILDELEGSFVKVRVDQNGTTTLKTDSNCRLDIYYVNTPKLKAFSNDKTLILQLLGKDTELDQISLAHSLSIYGNRPPKRNTFYTNISRLGYKQELMFQNGHMSVINDKLHLGNLNFTRSEPDFLANYSESFLTAVEKRMSDSQNIVFFSSG